jgi:hypothetical protein
MQDTRTSARYVRAAVLRSAQCCGFSNRAIVQRLGSSSGLVARRGPARYGEARQGQEGSAKVGPSSFQEDDEAGLDRYLRGTIILDGR